MATSTEVTITQIEATGADGAAAGATVTLRIETFGRPIDPAVLLISGTATSMLGWSPGLCRRLAEQQLFVIRYDQRDTGASTFFPRGEPGYGVAELAEDAAALLAELHIETVHVVGHSLGAGIALQLAAEHPQLVASLVLMSATTGARELSSGQGSFPELPEDLDAHDELISFLEADFHACDSLSPYYDADQTRRSIDAELAYAHDFGTTIANHLIVQQTMPGNDLFAVVDAPTLVVHGEKDGLFPPDHGQAVADELADATLLVLSGGGHDLLEHNHDQFLAAITEHIRSTAESIQ